MKLQKREITLNEADSVRDMLYLEERIARAYGEPRAELRTEALHELQSLLAQTKTDEENLQKLLKRAKERQL